MVSGRGPCLEHYITNRGVIAAGPGMACRWGEPRLVVRDCIHRSCVNYDGLRFLRNHQRGVRLKKVHKSSRLEKLRLKQTEIIKIYSLVDNLLLMGLFLYVIEARLNELGWSPELGHPRLF